MLDEQSYKNLLVEKVKRAKSLRGYKTYDECCKEFNRRYKFDIENGLIKELNKDFLSRVFAYKHGNKNFSISNPRFAKLCEFLNVDMHDTHQQTSISKAALLVDELIKQKPELENQIYFVVESITNLSKGVTAS